MGATEDRKLALERLRVRAEMRSMDLEEDSKVIDQEARSRAATKDVPPPLSWVIAVVRLVPPAQRLWPVLMVLLLVAAWASKKAGLW